MITTCESLHLAETLCLVLVMPLPLYRPYVHVFLGCLLQEVVSDLRLSLTRVIESHL